MVGTRNIPDTLVTLSLQLWYCAGMLGVRHQSWWGVLWFSKGHLKPLGRQRNPCHDIWFLINKIQANRVAIDSSVITKIFNPCKYWTVKIQPFVKHSVFQCLLCLLPVYCLTVDHSVFFCSIRCFFNLICCQTIQCLITLCILLFWHWICIPGTLIPINNNHLTVNKHNTADSTILV